MALFKRNRSQDGTEQVEPTESGDQTEHEVPDGSKRSVFGRLKTALTKTVQVLNTDIRDLVGKEGRLVDDDFLMELYADLVKTDMGAGPAGEIRDRIHKEFRARR